MPQRRDPPPTEEGWYALHDFYSIDWDAWRQAPERDCERAVDDAVEYLRSAVALEDAAEGDSAVYSIVGHKADLLVVHMRPSTADIGALERRFENTEFARFTHRSTSFVSVTEASGYSQRAREYFDGEVDEESGLARYIDSRLEPTIPDATHVCFYPMDKRRQPEQNWYDLSFEARAEHMAAHGEIGREYGGAVTQMITGAIGLDDWEWGVTLWGDDLTDVKDLLYEMRFDPSTSQFADFGSFYVGRRFPPADLPALLAGERVPTDGADSAGDSDHGQVESEPDDHGGTRPEATEAESQSSAETGVVDAVEAATEAETAGDGGTDDIVRQLMTLGLHAGEDYEAGDYGLVLYAEAEAEDLAEAVDGLRGNFEHYDSHVRTVVRAEGGRSAVASIWDSERAADTAEGFLLDLPGVTESVGGPIGETAAEETAAEETTTDETAADERPDDGPIRAGGDAADMREQLADLNVYAGQPHGEDVFALVLYSQADREELVDAVGELRGNFDRYETHEETSVYVDPESDTTAVVSLWETAEAADRASGFLTDLPGIVGWADEGEGWETMGMFYTVEPEHREEFVEKFDVVGGVLADMQGHRETALLFDHENENEMFIASQWDSREDAMSFFRSDAFTDTVDWGRDVLADRPRHVFLA
jgi:chlorite dismutase/heme-degrading monooxygenase HmoA